MTSPVEHVDDSLRLTADGMVELYQISLRNIPSGATAFLNLKDGPMGKQSVWNGITFDHLSLKMSGVSRTSEDQKSRPSLQIMNPEGIFNKPAFSGNFDGALLKRFRVLRTHFEANIIIADVNLWFIARPKDLVGGQSITLELRALSDGPEQSVPARQYNRPDFPFVTF